MSTKTWSSVFWSKVSKGNTREWSAWCATRWEMNKRKKREHISDSTCWCEPYLEYEDPDTGNQVWVHRELH